ncbi:hypothetical protein [Thermococcus sp.]|uniref:hypothetical protein n=1 Tax=Thermococcus sp. TaxID=35749 RepID=UPI0025CDD251|nr:hypothetical protein [Thermococcus sp.]
MKLEEAIRKYELRREESLRRAEKLRKKYNKWLEKKKRELLKALERLERAKPPKKVDERLLQIVEADRRNYISAMRHALEGIRTMEELGKRLSDISKIHLDYGKHVMILFEKEIYSINSILRELSEGYSEFMKQLMEVLPPKIDVSKKLEELKRTHEEFTEKKKKLIELAGRVEEERKKVEEVLSSKEFRDIEKEINDVSRRIRSIELELRSKVSKLQKPLKRMRLGGIADEVARDSGVALERPEEFISLLQSVYPRLDGKAKKSAEWLLANFESELLEVSKLKKELAELEERKRNVVKSIEPAREELSSLENELALISEELHKLERKLSKIEKELEDELNKLEEYLGEKIER